MSVSIERSLCHLSTHFLDWFEAPDHFSFSCPLHPVSIAMGSGDEIELCVPAFRLRLSSARSSRVPPTRRDLTSGT